MNAWSGGNTYPWGAAKDCSTQFGKYSWCIDENGNGYFTETEQYSKYNFGYRNCTDFVAHMLNKYNGVGFTNTYRRQNWGNANHWDEAARTIGFTVNGTPAVGSIAQSDAGDYGHVAYVIAVSLTGTVTVAEYNQAGTGAYGTRTVAKTTFEYIHIRDLSKPSFSAKTPASTLPKGQGYSYTFTASGRPAPTFSLSTGALPPGLSLSSKGVLSGTPSKTGSYSFRISATNVVGSTTTPTLKIAVTAPPTITAEAAPDGLVGQSYGYQLKATGYPTPTFAVGAGSLPDGLTLSATGLLSGVPTTEGTWFVSITATNTVGSDSTAVIEIVIGPGAPTST